jgi:RIO kinase 1
MQYVVRMLCAGLVHGDLSEFNVLVDEDGPVIIDLPQAVDAAANNNAHAMLERDVSNMTDYYGLFAPQLLKTRYAQEIWEHYEEGTLHPDIELSGYAEEDTHAADVDSIMLEIKAAMAEEEERQERIRDAQELD